MLNSKKIFDLNNKGADSHIDVNDVNENDLFSSSLPLRIIDMMYAYSNKHCKVERVSCINIVDLFATATLSIDSTASHRVAWHTKKHDIIASIIHWRLILACISHMPVCGDVG